MIVRTATGNIPRSAGNFMAGSQKKDSDDGFKRTRVRMR
jgi:hypothetical protein